ncbi:MAG: hypothetical protein WBV94_30075 [Blastocatellia bacterium]
MAASPAKYALSPSFNVRDYVKATNDAAKRTRTITIILVVASGLIFTGWYNSLIWSWPIDRVRRAYDPEDSTIFRSLDLEHRTALLRPNENGTTPTEKFRSDLQVAVSRAYVENVRFIRIPFVGIAFDVNDLGTIGGIGLIIILVLMRFSLSREIKNLRVSFREAVRHDQLCHFYHALAMTQVFTVPHMRGEKRNPRLALAPKLICILPAIIFSAGVTYDYITILTSYKQFNFSEVNFPMFLETLWLVIIWMLSYRCWERQSYINAIWNRFWKRLKLTKTSVILLDEDLVEKFGTDEAVNKALRRFEHLEATAKKV